MREFRTFPDFRIFLQFGVMAKMHWKERFGSIKSGLVTIVVNAKLTLSSMVCALCRMAWSVSSILFTGVCCSRRCGSSGVSLVKPRLHTRHKPRLHTRHKPRLHTRHKPRYRLHYSVRIFLTEWLFVVNFWQIPPRKLACWRSLLREAGGEKVKATMYSIQPSACARRWH
jgi:hypothetical protein